MVMIMMMLNRFPLGMRRLLAKLLVRLMRLDDIPFARRIRAHGEGRDQLLQPLALASRAGGFVGAAHQSFKALAAILTYKIVHGHILSLQQVE